MSAPLFVMVRICLTDVLAIEVRHPTGDRKAIRKNDSPFEGYTTGDGWIILPAAEGRGRPCNEWETLWDDLHIEVYVQQVDLVWKLIDSWEEIDAVLIATALKNGESA